MPDQIDQLIEKLQIQELSAEKKTAKEAIVSTKETIKNGIAVAFEKISNNKIIKKITSADFTKKAIASLAAIGIIVGAAAASLMPKSSVKLQRGGFSSQTFKIPKFDEEQIEAHRLQIQNKIFTYEDLEQNEDLINNEGKDVIDNTESKDTVQIEKKSYEEIAKEVIQGKWGNGLERKEKLKEAGYTGEEIAQIQAQVNAFYNPQQEITTESKKDSENIVENPIKPEEKEEEEPVLPPEAFAPGHIYPNPSVVPPVVEVERPVLHQPSITIPGPTYTIEGDEVITDIEFHPIVTPEPEVPSKTTVDVKVGKGDTLVVETKDGKVAVDNSDGMNYNDLEEGTSIDYTSSSAIDSVHYNDQDETVEVTIDKDEVTPTTVEQRELDQQILDDYEQILREMGISSNTYEDAGRTR